VARDRIEGFLQTIRNYQETTRPARDLPFDLWGIPSYNQSTHGEDYSMFRLFPIANFIILSGLLSGK